MDLNNWKTQLRKGLLEMVVLNLLQNGKIHGYEMVQKLKRLDGLKIREGNIYAILARLRIDGLVKGDEEASEDGPPRRYFELTRQGRNVLEDMNSHWDTIKDGLKIVMRGAIK